MSWRAQVLTLYPDMFPGPLGQSLAGRALDRGDWTLDVFNIRDVATDRHRTVDDAPYGGGPGMVLRADILAEAIDNARNLAQYDTPLIYLSPRGRQFDQNKARELAEKGGATFICGRFEGVDERVLDARDIEELSIGDYVLSGGEIAALAVMDAVVRLLPGVMGAESTLDEESFTAGLLEYPHYTRPPEWEGRSVPDVLQSGDHGKIAAWRRSKAEELTRQRRPDLWEQYLAGAGSKTDKNEY